MHVMERDHPQHIHIADVNVDTFHIVHLRTGARISQKF